VTPLWTSQLDQFGAPLRVSSLLVPDFFDR
jgi:hypothetical protein